MMSGAERTLVLLVIKTNSSVGRPMVRTIMTASYSRTKPEGQGKVTFTMMS